tara:strand:+ start:122 stop:517 length:396 start_codon:yes stop_codon:yes gene_type:complete
MSQVIKLFNISKSPKQKEDEKKLEKSCQDQLSAIQFLLETLLVEDERFKNNYRWIRSKKIIEDAMVVTLMHEELIRTLIGLYREDYGDTLSIGKMESYMTNKVLVYLDAAIEPYLYLVDMKECQRQVNECL